MIIHDKLSVENLSCNLMEENWEIALSFCSNLRTLKIGQAVNSISIVWKLVI